MASRHHHELLFRGDEAMRRLAHARVVLCGVGAIGSNLAEALARQGVQQLVLIDRDRVEEHNISTQTFIEEDVGGKKAEVVANRIYDATSVEVEAVTRELGAGNVAKLLRGAELVVDGFDNHASRALVAEHCGEAQIACLHAGLSPEGFAEVCWNERYRVPDDAPDGPDVCDYPMARNLIMLCVTVASEVVVRYLASGDKQSYSMTLGDLRINREDHD